MNTDTLKITNLSLKYERWGQSILALNKFNLTVPPGQWLMIVGPNGAGKSTLLRIIAGQLKSYQGEINVSGRSFRKMGEVERVESIYYVQQNPENGSASMLSVYENLVIADPCSVRLPKRILEEKYHGLLAEAGLQYRLHHPAGQLSGGERQVLALLIARLRPSSLVLLDEAFAALDFSRVEICTRLARELQVKGKTLLFVTHSLEFAVEIGDRTVAICNGKIACDETSLKRDIQTFSTIINENILNGKGNDL